MDYYVIRRRHGPSVVSIGFFIINLASSKHLRLKTESLVWKRECWVISATLYNSPLLMEKVNGADTYREENQTSLFLVMWIPMLRAVCEKTFLCSVFMIYDVDRRWEDGGCCRVVYIWQTSWFSSFSCKTEKSEHFWQKLKSQLCVTSQSKRHTSNTKVRFMLSQTCFFKQYFLVLSEKRLGWWLLCERAANSRLM